MREKILTIFLGTITILSGCIKLQDNQQVIAPIDIPQASRTVTLPNVLEEGGLGFGTTVQATFTVGEAWSIDPETVPAWLTVEPMSGDKGVVTLNFSVKQENATYAQDTGEITISPLTGTPATIAAIQLGFSAQAIYSPVAGGLSDVMTGLGITDPTSVKIVGNLNADDLYAIRGLSSLTEINIKGSHLEDNYLLPSLFQNNEDLQSVVLPVSLTAIQNYSFSQCYGLTSIDLPAGVTTIGSAAFVNCTGLETITMPAELTSIGEGAFGGCTALTSITLPANVTTIADYAFNECTSLTTVHAKMASPVGVVEDIFLGAQSQIALTVPPGKVVAYTSGGWGGFASIIEEQVP